MIAKTLAHSLLGLVLPASCTCCGEPADRTHDGLTVCPACRKALAATAAQPFCPRCGRTVGPYASCGQCSRKSPPFQAAVRAGTYDSPLGDMIRALKYRDGVYTLPLLADLLLARLHQAGLAERIDLATAVPLHWWRCYRRGFNQAALLARTVVRRGRLRLPLRRLLVRTRDTPPQVGLSATARRENVRGAFRVRDPAMVKDRRILLLDDVMTTGATVGECARALRRAGAREVVVAVAAIAGSGPMVVASGPAVG
ncbi:MAG: ComF family protein, partial [Planctomycetes bacterium]|nr:ComF family protein [Planctomycetota bacterium]